MLKKLIESEESDILIQILRNVLQLDIQKIEYCKNIKLNNASEYEFELVKVKVTLSTKEEIEITKKTLLKIRQNVKDKVKLQI